MTKDPTPNDDLRTEILVSFVLGDFVNRRYLSTIMIKPLLRRIGVVLALLSILVSYGGPWGVLQTIAWSSMLVQYSRDGGLVQGVQDTFDGDHPCALCTKISQARQQSEPATQLATATSYPPVRHFAALVGLLVPPSSTSSPTLFSNLCGTDLFLDQPPTPPPRAGV